MLVESDIVNVIRERRGERHTKVRSPLKSARISPLLAPH